MDEEVSSFQEHLYLRLFMVWFLVELSQCSDYDVKALLSIKQQLNGGVLPDWYGSNPCNWTGIECGGSSNSVVRLSLPYLNLSGTLAPVIGNLSSLREVNLTGNYLSGPIPSELRNCRGLQILDLSWNSFVGNFSGLFDLENLVVLFLEHNKLKDTIPPTVGTLQSLKHLNLSLNGAFGDIPDHLGNCTSLSSLDLSRNKFSGPIPPSLFHLKQLRELILDRNKLIGTLDDVETTAFGLEHLSLTQNKLSGQIPGFIFKLPELTVLKVSWNNFTGPIPLSLSSLTKLQVFHLSHNSLSGEIPSEFGKLSALRQLYMNHNELTGAIPRELFLCRNLTFIILHHNQLSSQIPHEIGNLIFLRNLALNDNNLTGTIPVELANCSLLDQINLSRNYISGELPGDLVRIGNLSRLYLANNQLTGSIPSQFSSMPSLEYLILSHNLFTGTVPNNFSAVCQLLNLELEDNQLTGAMPSSLAKLQRLQKLDVSRNQLSGGLEALSMIKGGKTAMQLQRILLYDNQFAGALPTDWIADNLLTLDMHGNNFSGQIPKMIGELFQVQLIDLSSNQFDGPIPPELGNCAYLTSLNLSFNRLEEEIPDAIAESWQIYSNVTVDLSSNQLIGQIPQSLSLSHLKLNVSNNNLSGSIPPLLRNLNTSFFLGNRLCGPPLATKCTQEKGKAVKFIVLGVVLGCWTTSALVVLVCIRSRAATPWPILHCRRGVQVEGIETSGPSVTFYASWFGETCSNEHPNDKPPKLSPTLSDLSRATGGFSSEHIIGDGGFGKVYKGVLNDGTIVAIKKLTEDGYQGEREFVAELETLGSVRHQNLVRLFGYCSKDLERLLVYEYMPNNSLDVWLYSRTEGMEPLPWQVRMTIARDVARGLAFLHHFCIPKIVHRDLKASNVLLDANFNARLADFGLARHINTYESHVSTGVAGSLGYIAPEYAQSWRVTTRGDVFSFGVVLLELLSGKRPAGGAYKPIQGGNLLGWVHHLFLTNQVSALFFDAALGSVQGSDVEKEVMAALEIALRCTRDDPVKRPPMLEVLRNLEDLRFLSSSFASQS